MGYCIQVCLVAFGFILRKLPVLLFCLCLFFSQQVFAQNADISTEQMVDMELSDLLRVKVVSVSKKSETVFDAVLSVSSISRDEIQRAGATSIMEALRLVPGLIVVEVSNGNYNVYLRGLSNLPPASSLGNSTNLLTLVMIDNRPVYNYFNGGTFWETLPVDLNDVDRIEVVRGPSSALYGPNAAAGVINIITRKLNKDGISVVANAQGGVPATMIGNTSVGYRKDKFSAIVSGNFQQRQRTEDDYYLWGSKKRVPSDSITSYYSGGPLVDENGNNNLKDRYPDPSLAQRKFGYNAFLNYQLSEKSNVALAVGGQQSQVQKVLSDELSTPLTTSGSQTNYADLRLKLGNLNIMLADQIGTQDIAKGVAGYKFDFNTVDGVIDYDFKVGGLHFRPGINVRSAAYDDSRYVDDAHNAGFINGKKELNNIAGSLYAEYDLKQKLKLIAALRFDKYNHPEKVYTSYEFAASYKFNENNLVRAAYSRAFRGPTFFDIYNSQTFYVTDIPVGNQMLPGYAVAQGNLNAALLQIDMAEVGYRASFGKLQLDLDIFYMVSRNYFIQTGGALEVSPDSSKVTSIQKAASLPLLSKELGGTLSLSYASGKLQVKPFVTIQTTRLENVSMYRDSPEANPVQNYTVTYNTEHNGTPNVYGGFYLNYKFTEKLNANLSGYYFSRYTYNGLYSNFAANRSDGLIDVPSKILLNAKVSYELLKGFNVFVNGRNMFNQTSFEFAQTDKISLMVLAGVSFIY